MKRILQITYTSDNEPMSCAEIKSIIKRIDGVGFISLATVSSKRATRNVYGKEVDELEFDAMDPESNESWFDDYDFVFELTVSTLFDAKELLIALDVAGISATDVTNEIMTQMKSLYHRIKEEREKTCHSMIQYICDRELRALERDWLGNEWDVVVLRGERED